MSGIFISYRRDGAGYIAGRLRAGLAAHFGAEMIFRDIDTMKPGVDFVDRIEKAVGSCDALVVVIGDDWVTVTDQRGRRRLDQPRDFVRLEITAALQRDILVVPVLVENARPVAEEDLPAPLRKLAQRQALDLTDARWDYDLQKLIEALEEVVKPPVESGPAVEPRPAERAETDEAPASPVPWWSRGGPPWVKALVAALVLVAVAIPVLSRSVSETGRDNGGTGSATPTSASPPSTEGTAAVYEGPWSATRAGLTLTVEKIESASDEVRVHFLVDNGTGSTLSLHPNDFQMVDKGGHSYPPDDFANLFGDDWPREFPPGEVRGVIRVNEPLQPDPSPLKVGFSDFHGDIFVENITLA